MSNTIKHSPAYDLALFLVDQGIGDFGGSNDWCINVSGLPEAPVNAVSLQDTPGFPPLHYNLQIKRPSLQVVIRGLNYLETYSRIDSINTLLLNNFDYRTDQFVYVGADSISDVENIGKDEKGYFLFSANYTLIRQATIS